MQHHESHLSLVPTGVYPGSGSGNTMQLIPGVNPLMSGELAPHLGKLHVSQISVMVMVRYSLREEFDSLVLGSLPARVNDLPVQTHKQARAMRGKYAIDMSRFMLPPFTVYCREGVHCLNQICHEERIVCCMFHEIQLPGLIIRDAPPG